MTEGTQCSEPSGRGERGGHPTTVGPIDAPSLDALNHEIEVLHDPTHVRSYRARRWWELFRSERAGDYGLGDPVLGDAKWPNGEALV